MPDDTRREQILNALECTLSTIKTGTSMDFCNCFAQPVYELLDRCEVTTGWNYYDEAAAPTVNSVTFVEGLKSLNLGKTGTGGKDARYEKTISPPVDATDLVGLMNVYVKDTTGLATSKCFTIKFGSDSSNYYEMTVNKGGVDTDVWLRYGREWDDMTQVGLPDITAISFISFII